MSQLPTAEQVTNLYLYGQRTTPLDMTSDALIRASSAPPMAPVQIDIATYMAGPGRFASASRFEIVEKFLNPSLFAASNGIPPGVYSKDDLYIRFGITSSSSDFQRKIVTVDQAQYDDGQDDFLERAYIWNTTAFKIQDGASFVVEANGNRYIDNFTVVPYSDPAKPENFDFSAGSPFGKYIVNPVLEPKVDPSKIGIKVTFDFISPLAGSRFTYLDYVTASTTAKTANPALYAVIAAQGAAFLDRLWQTGATRFIDPDGRAIFYGSDKADSNLSQYRFDYSVVDPLDSRMRTAVNQKGVALIGGAGSDRLYGGARDDYLNGGKDNDALSGGVGLDTYVFKAGDGKDSITDSDGLGIIKIAGVSLTGAGPANYKVAGSNQGQWSVNGGQTTYTLDEAHQRLVISGTSLGAGNDITIKDVNVDKLLGKTGIDGYLGIKLTRTSSNSLKTADQSTPYATPGAVAQSASKTIGELGGAALKWFTNIPALFGDTFTVAVKSGDASKAKLVTGAETLALTSPVTINLAEGQTERAFAIVNDSAIASDQTLELVATYHRGGETLDSNTFTLNITDAGAIANTRNGDQRAKLIGLEIDTHILPGNPLYNTYKWSATSWAADGTLTGGVAEPNFSDVIDGTASNDKLTGAGGNDALSGGAGNDEIDGGAGDDLIGGGAGSDKITGGDGNDYINSSATLNVQQRLSPTDTWSPPGTQVVKTQGAGWGIYIDTQSGSPVTVWSGSDNPAGAHARPARLAGRKGLGRRMDRAWAITAFGIKPGEATCWI